jgi:hypothetical protein
MPAAEAKELEDTISQTNNRYDQIRLDLGQLATSVTARKWTRSGDHIVTLGMEYHGTWRDQHATISRKLTEIDDLTKLHNLTDLQGRILDTSSEVVDLSTRINLVILDIEAAHKTIEACPFKLLSFSGDASEDLITFKGDFQNATADNRISKKDQLGELRECLTGKAAAKLPLHGLRDIEEVRQLLQETFGNTCANLNHKLSRIERTTGLTDRLVETNPLCAATWFLDYGNAVEEIVNLGDQGPGLEALALNAHTL